MHSIGQSHDAWVNCTAMYHPGNLYRKMDESVNIGIIAEAINVENTVASDKQNETLILYDEVKDSAQSGNNVTTPTPKDRLENIRNLPGFHNTLVGMNVDPHMEPPKAKRLKLSPSMASAPVSDSNETAEIGKRRRIQHDYRRLSSSGYLDDYETSRERRFSSDSDVTSNSPSPNKLKVTTPPANGKEPEYSKLPPVKLTLKISKAENGMFVNGSANGKNLFESYYRISDLK